MFLYITFNISDPNVESSLQKTVPTLQFKLTAPQKETLGGGF